MFLFFHPSLAQDGTSLLHTRTKDIVTQDIETYTLSSILQSKMRKSIASLQCGNPYARQHTMHTHMAQHPNNVSRHYIHSPVRISCV
jgi:hypothetical protein